MSGPWEAYHTSGPWDAYRPKIDKAQARRDALEGTSVLHRAGVNLGAGLDAAWTGVKDLLGQASDEEVREQRGLAEGAAESLPYAGKALQFAGEVAPTMAIPGAGYARGAKALMKMAPTGARLGTAGAALDAGLAGALQGMLQATEGNESRGVNAVLGAAGGQAVVGLAALGRPVRDLLTRGGAEAKAAKELIDAVGGERQAEKVLAKIRAYQPGPVTRDIPMSVAEITQNPALARQERGAATRFTEDWAPQRKAQHDARYEALQRATAGADNLAPAQQARKAATAPLRDDALTAATQGDYKTPVEATIAWMKAGESATNPALFGSHGVATYAANAVKDATPEQLYTVRKVLLAKLNGKMQLGDELAASAKQARAETMHIVKSIDEAIDGASGGKWKPYLAEYADKSGEVNSAEAQALIRKSFDRAGASQTSGVPDVTGFRLGKSVEKFGKNSYGSKLDAEAIGRIMELRGNLDLSEGLQKLMRGTGTSGGGSNTAMDLSSIATDVTRSKLTTIIPLLGEAIKRSDAMTKAAMSDALRNPERFTAAVTRKLEQSRPLTRSEESVLALLRSIGAGGTLELAQQR